MALREKLAERVQPLLEPGEQIRHVFMAQGGISPWVGGLLSILGTQHYVVAVTDRAIVLINSGKVATTKLGDVDSRLPLHQIGPVKGIWAKTNTLGKKLYIHRRFHKDVEAADAEVAGQAPPPPPAAPAV